MTMSVGMLQGLNALVSLNSQIADLQQQGATGKKINNASDGLAAYLSSQGFTNRAERLQNVNDTLGTNLQTIKAAQTGLSSIRKTITDTLDTLKAASQTQSYVAAQGAVYGDNPVTDGSNTASLGLSFSLIGADAQQSVATINGNTKLVNPVNGNAGTLRLNGVSLADGMTFNVNGKYIKIAATDPTTNGDASANNPFVVSTVRGLLDQLRGAVGGGSDNSGALTNYNTFGNANNRIVLQAGNGVTTINYQQTAGTALSAATLDQLFAAGRTAQNTDGSYYDKRGQTSAVGQYFSGSVSVVKQTLTTVGVNGQSADARRAAAAKSYKLAIDQINQYLQSASVSGINLLNGDKLKTTFDEKGNSSQIFLAKADNTALTLSAFGLGLVDVNGNQTDTNTNFQINDDALDAQGKSSVGLNAVINKLTDALSTLNLGDSQVSQFQATVQNRVDFNKSIISLLTESANSLTAADMTQVSAQYAALQVQQGLAQTMLANTKQSDQSILQLLR